MVMSRKKARPVGDIRLETTKEYWEQVLSKEGLSMDAGRDPGHRKLALVGSTKDLEDVYEMLAGENGRVRPEGAGPDDSAKE
jgi:hypothetical protein